MAKLYAMAASHMGLTPPMLSEPRMQSNNNSTPSGDQIKCSDCGHLVSLMELGLHVCPSASDSIGQMMQMPPETSDSTHGLGIEGNTPRKWNLRAAGLRINTAAKSFKGI